MVRPAARAFGAALVALGLTLPPVAARAQAVPPATGGAIELALALRGLGADQRVLVIGAHPDDEDTDLLAVLARGRGAQAAYLSLTRGEGGQNLIGPQLGPGLGLLRSEELLAARRTDGARQFFTRAIDYGYSKTLDEALEFWPRDSLLKDVVRVIRRFRPQVIVSIFSGTDRDGHGQHQAAGWVARAGFRAAGDAAAFPELAIEEGLDPWAPAKLFRSTRFDAAATTDSLDAGALDPAVGQSFHQIAMRSRSLHQSQDMGQLQAIGPSRVRLALELSRVGGGTLFDGLDTSLAGVLGAEAAARLARLADSLRALGPADGTRAEPLLERAWALLPPAAAGLDDQRRRLGRAEAIFRGVVVDLVSPEASLVPGSRLAVELLVWNGGKLPASLRTRVDPTPGSGWVVEAHQAACHHLAPGELRRDTVRVVLRPDAPTSDPYFMRAPPVGWLYDWSAAPPEVRGEPFEPAPLSATVEWCGAGVPRALAWRDLSHRRNDQAAGEVRQPVSVRPRVGVTVAPAVALWSAARPAPRRVTVTLAHHADSLTRGTVMLELPPGWRGGAAQPFRLEGWAGTTLDFDVHPPAEGPAGRATLQAVALGEDGTRWDSAMELVNYPHITARAHTEPAIVTAAVAVLTPARLRRIGYVRGAADQVPEALRALDLPVEILDGATLLGGDLAAYDVIVIGSRAYEVDSALVGANQRLLDYVAAGGVVVTQYQQQAFFRGGYAPPGLDPAPPDTVRGRPAFPRFERVTDETAPVRVLVPGHPAFTRPHIIGPADWADWVQERGLYFAPRWSDAWEPLLEMADPGQEPQRGVLLLTRHGRGTYVYSGLSFFRQLPAGVPGAWRLFLNLLALGADPTS